MSKTILFATQDSKKADRFIGSHSNMTLFVVKSTSVLDLWKDGKQQPPWHSAPGTGEDEEWILIIATNDEVTLPKGAKKDSSTND